ncbi:conserved hypothetical protein [Microcystis aeruginosa PCC 9807]|nr:conserved hypothetical protein [Microcystis aeruginosa PCC 9807]
MSQPRPKLLADWLSNPPNEMIKIVETEVGLGEKEIGSGFEVPLGSIWVDPESKKRYQWNERWLVVKSNALASRQIKGLGSRLIKGEEKLLSLQKRPGKDEKVLEQKVREALQKLGLTR